VGKQRLDVAIVPANFNDVPWLNRSRPLGLEDMSSASTGNEAGKPSRFSRLTVARPDHSAFPGERRGIFSGVLIGLWHVHIAERSRNSNRRTLRAVPLSPKNEVASFDKEDVAKDKPTGR
jgi:hypothetical protein